MPVYTYRREDGTTFDIRQRFGDSPLQACPNTGQAVQRVIQPAGIIFKGSGFYVNDNNKAKNPTKPAANGNGKSADNNEKKPAKAESKNDSKSPSKDKTPAAAIKG
ncbi:MAG: zinc ribbon domain-containing protein [Chloroflexi bacterium]|nr:zinc ribbon domain-containing protein [Chloroflexota bacterium]